jgi:hypothetical protein
MATRQEICDALKSQLETIQVANGYSSNAGLQVLDWSGVLIEPKTNCIIFGDTDEKYVEQNGRIRCELTVEIETTLFTENYGVAGRLALTDMIRAIYKRKSLGLPKVMATVLDNSIDIDKDGRDVVFVYLKTEITYYDDIL